MKKNAYIVPRVEELPLSTTGVLMVSDTPDLPDPIVSRRWTEVF